MTEQQWLTCNDLAKMLTFLVQADLRLFAASKRRKLRLAAAAISDPFDSLSLSVDALERALFHADAATEREGRERGRQVAILRDLFGPVPRWEESSSRHRPGGRGR